MTLPTQILFIREVGDDSRPYWAAASEDGGHLALEQGETHLGGGRCRVASLRPGQWTLPDDTLLVATDRRIAFLTTAFDKGGGWVGSGPAGLAVALTANAISHRKAANRSAGKVAAGHLRYEWIESVELCRRKALIGVVDTYLDVTVATTAGRAVIELWGRGVANDEFAHWLVSMVARQRLELHVEMESADRATLERLRSSGGAQEAARLSGVAKWLFPGNVEDLISAASAPQPLRPPAITEAPQPQRPPMNGNGSVPDNRTNALSIVSFVSAFFVSIVAIVTGHMALNQIKKSNENGRGLAIAGLVIGYISATATLALLIFALVGSVANVKQVNQAISAPTSTSTVTPTPVTPAPMVTRQGGANTGDVPTKDLAGGRTWTGKLTLNTVPLGIELDGALAPQAVSSTVHLIETGFYAGTSCHRLTEAAGFFLLQCGDPTGTGSGGPGYSYGPIENAPLSNVYPAGTIAMARQGANAYSIGSQFFIVYDDTTIPADAVGGYTVLGKVTSGLDQLKKKITDAGVQGGGSDGAPAVATTITAVTAQ